MGQDSLCNVYIMCVNIFMIEWIHYLRHTLCFQFSVLSLLIFWVLWWISGRGEECWKEKPQRGSEDPLRSLIQTPAHGSSLLLQRVLRMTKARCAAVQEGVSPFEAGTLTKRRIGLKDAPQQDTDCYQVSLLNIETSPFEHVGSVCDVIKKKVFLHVRKSIWEDCGLVSF